MSEHAGPVPPADPGLYAEIQQFYARQVQLLGTEDIDSWSRTFAEDAVFEQETEPGRTFARGAPSHRRGRAAIAAAARGAVQQRREQKTVRRYLIGMLDVAPQGDGSVRTEYCAVLIQTGQGEQPVVHLSTTGRDLLVRERDAWQVRHRINSHDNKETPHG